MNEETIKMVELPVEAQGMANIVRDDGRTEVVEAWYFKHAGMSLAVTAEPLHSGYFRVTEPVSGLGISLTMGKTRDESYSRFLNNIPIYDRIAKEKHGKTMAQVVADAQENPAEAVSLSKRNQATAKVQDVFGAKM